MTDLEPLSSDQLSVVGFIEEYWMKKGKFPSVSEVEKFKPDFELDSNLRHPTFRLALKNRGVALPKLKRGELLPRDLTDEQIAAIRAVLDYEDKRSHSAKLRSLGITTTQWNGWLRNPKFKELLHELSGLKFQDSLHIAQEGLVKRLEIGDTHAIKLYLELTGRQRDESPAIQNIKLIMAQIIEAIQIHVRDPETIKRISNDFEQILQGRNPNQLTKPLARIERVL